MVLGSVVLFPSLYGGLCSMCYFVQEFSFCWGMFAMGIFAIQWRLYVHVLFFCFSLELFKAADSLEALDV